MTEWNEKPVGDVFEGAAGGGEGLAGEAEGAGGRGDGGRGGGGGGGGELELGGGDGGGGAVDAVLPGGDVLGQGVGEEVVDGLFLLEVDDSPDQAGEFLANAERPPALEGAGGGGELLDEAGARGGGEDGVEHGVGGVGEDGVDPRGGGMEGAVAKHGLDDAIVHGEGAGGADVAKAASGVLDVLGGDADGRHVGLVGDVSGSEGPFGRLRVEGDEGALGVGVAGVGGGGRRVGLVGLLPFAVVGEEGGFAGDGLGVGHRGRASRLDSGVVDGLLVQEARVDVVVHDAVGEVVEAADVGSPEGREGAVGDSGGERGGAAAKGADGVAVGARAAKEDVRAAEDLEPERTAGAFARGVVAGGVVGEEEGGEDLALLPLARGELLAAKAAGDSPHAVWGDLADDAEVGGVVERGDGEVAVGVVVLVG